MQPPPTPEPSRTVFKRYEPSEESGLLGFLSREECVLLEGCLCFT